MHRKWTCFSARYSWVVSGSPGRTQGSSSEECCRCIQLCVGSFRARYSNVKSVSIICSVWMSGPRRKPSRGGGILDALLLWFLYFFSCILDVRVLQSMYARCVVWGLHNLMRVASTYRAPRHQHQMWLGKACTQCHDTKASVSGCAVARNYLHMNTIAVFLHLSTANVVA